MTDYGFVNKLDSQVAVGSTLAPEVRGGRSGEERLSSVDVGIPVEVVGGLVLQEAARDGSAHVSPEVARPGQAREVEVDVEARLALRSRGCRIGSNRCAGCVGHFRPRRSGFQ